MGLLTPLHLSIIWNRLEVFQLLLEDKADHKIKREDGATPLALARFSSPEIREILESLEAGNSEFSLFFLLLSSSFFFFLLFLLLLLLFWS